MKYVYLFLMISLAFMLACGGNQEQEQTPAAETAEEIGEEPIEPEKEYTPVNEFGEWREISSKEGDFRFMMPGEPYYAVDTVNTPRGPVEYPSYTLDTPEKHLMIGYSDMPEDLVAQAPERVVLEGAVRGVVEESRGTSVLDTLIQNDSMTARESIVTLPDDKSVMRVRAYMSGNRVYIVAATAPVSDTAGLLGRFVESFELLQHGAK
ncbi:MAG: hypothetical protein GWO41_11000 [candidate division Zixibacteria bacterium]|nr:hypothetical protein [candidate division Zixibacteria bacterium]NIR68057.1 hypothetical protein [candidate division Zixibacteria bacterium]NIS16841.1 hypothetical protein [candidate division Zixibacteria bacterium]NIS49276.1 hypothetical protein [candidate division Zixibacteria bacterium]NIT53243.1 hypothetical protein [candidate division Zixibacteria bacterium]